MSLFISPPCTKMPSPTNLDIKHSQQIVLHCISNFQRQGGGVGVLRRGLVKYWVLDRGRVEKLFMEWLPVNARSPPDGSGVGI